MTEQGGLTSLQPWPILKLVKILFSNPDLKLKTNRHKDGYFFQLRLFPNPDSGTV